MSSCLHVSNLTKCYGRIVAVSGLSLEVQTGEVLGLLGPNGAGKSTTLGMLCGLIKPDSGSISLFGMELRRNFLDVMARIGVLVDKPDFYDYLSARTNLMLLARLGGKSVTIDRALDRLGLLHVADRRVGDLSRGTRQRLGLAQAMLTDPELLILDEPTNGLDIESSQEVLGLLRRLADEAKVTIIVSSHLLHEVELLCDRVAILSNGRLLACERTQSLLSYDLTQIEIMVDAPEAAARRLSEQTWVESTAVHAGRVHVRLRTPNVHQLTSFLVGTGYVVSGVMPRRRTLQDYFLKVMNT